MTLAIFFIAGLAVGSFLNVLVYRINVAETFFWGRSKCPHCKKVIAWYDNIPLISFVLLKFKCRKCRKKISWQYPLVELTTGILFAAVGARYFIAQDSFSWLVTIYFLGVFGFLMAIFVYDFLYMEIPEILIWPSIAWALVFNLVADWRLNDFSAGLFSVRTYSGILAAVLAFAFFFLLSAGSREKWMGMGDAYLAFFIGLVLGWPQVLLALFLAFSIGSIYGIILIVSKKKTVKSQLPFAPFLVLGTVIAIFYYYPIAEWYLGLFRF